jgi:hypothetical protein
MQNKNGKPNVEFIPEDEYRLLSLDILSHQLCLVFKRGGKDQNEMGTAVSVNIGKKTFLLTAAHNFAADTSEHTGVFTTQTPNRLGNLQKYVKGSCLNEELDIAVIEFDNKKQLVNTLPEKMLYPDKLPEWINCDKCGFFISGYQGQLAAMLSNETVSEQILTLSTLFNCNYISPGNWPDCVSKRKTPDHHIVGKIQPCSDWVVCGPEKYLGSNRVNLKPPDNIGGLSGGGMWLSCKHRPPIIAPRNYLIGVETSWLESKQVVFGVKIIHFLDMIENNYPELTDNIQKIKCRVAK